MGEDTSFNFEGGIIISENGFLLSQRELLREITEASNTEFLKHHITAYIVGARIIKRNKVKTKIITRKERGLY